MPKPIHGGPMRDRPMKGGRMALAAALLLSASHPALAQPPATVEDPPLIRVPVEPDGEPEIIVPAEDASSAAIPADSQSAAPQLPEPPSGRDRVVITGMVPIPNVGAGAPYHSP
ncbi:MAG TPA: hypothetical protein VG942_14255, partial [Hyphomonadaceae bacterium]|nr:hypothetical protein [Hyphomonadaceae bacterium]